MSSQVVSKKRVADHGEVFTGKREVIAMLDLVKQETERIDSRFLEPACGTGNFLTEILARKLRVVEARYKRLQLDWERNAVVAVSSVYGIDILEDNVALCRQRLYIIFDADYARLYKKRVKEECRDAVKFILEKNIVHGDALTLKTAGPDPRPIIFSEWSSVRGSLFKRRDFAFHELIQDEKTREPSLFAAPDTAAYSDLGEKVFLPSPVKDYPLTHFLRIAHEHR